MKYTIEQYEMHIETFEIEADDPETALNLVRTGELDSSDFAYSHTEKFVIKLDGKTIKMVEVD